MNSANTTNRVAVNKALQVLEVFRTLDQDMPIGEAVSFLLISQGETSDGGGLSVTDLHQRGGFVIASASRYMRSLSTKNRKGEPGYGLVTDERDPMDDRRKVLRISPKGARVVQLIANAIEG